MRSAITLALDPKGKAKIISGTEVPIGQQKAAFAKLRLEELPKGVASIELWTSDGGRIKKSTGPVKPAEASPEDKNPAAE